MSRRRVSLVSIAEGLSMSVHERSCARENRTADECETYRQINESLTRVTNFSRRVVSTRRLNKYARFHFHRREVPSRKPSSSHRKQERFSFFRFFFFFFNRIFASSYLDRRGAAE